jgi:hypothetical protein
VVTVYQNLNMSTSEEGTMEVGETVPIETTEPATVETPEPAPAPVQEQATHVEPIPTYSFAFGTAAHPLPLPKPAPIPAINAPLPNVFNCLGIALRKLCPQFAHDGPRLLTPSSHAFMTTIFERIYDFGIKNYADDAGFDVLDGTYLGNAIRGVLRNMFHDVEDLVMLAQQSGEVAAMELDDRKRKSMQSFVANLEGFTPLVNNLFVRHGYVNRDRGVGAGEEAAEGVGRLALAEDGEVHRMTDENGEEIEVVYAEQDEDGEDDDDDDDDNDNGDNDESDSDSDDDEDVYMTADEGQMRGDDDEASDLALEEGELAEN